jgi:hypothetical protein
VTESERAVKYIQTSGPAISGSAGHNHTLALACNLFKQFDLTQADALYTARRRFARNAITKKREQ